MLGGIRVCLEVSSDPMSLWTFQKTNVVLNHIVMLFFTFQKTYGDEPMSPQPSSTDSGFSYQLTPDRISLQSGFFNSGEKDVIKKGWAVKQGHVVRSYR